MIEEEWLDEKHARVKRALELSGNGHKVGRLTAEGNVIDPRTISEQRHDTIYAIYYETLVHEFRQALDNCPASDITGV